MAVSKTQIERRMRRFTKTCQAHGLKLTHQRMEVFRELAGADDHPDAETIYRGVSRRVPAISRDTVYRTLATLEERGLVRKAEILASKGRYDANMDRHHHFVCTECGLVRDFYSETLDELPLPKSVKTLGHVESAHVQLRGICSKCARGNR
jgi:Fur family transcriptional regulator, peroxide stress response regulator